MAMQILRPIWSAPLQRFRDLITGRFISAAAAAPFLRAYPSVRGLADVVIRDAAGRFVPSRFFGGEILKHFPTGMGTTVGVRRAMPGPPEEFLYRSRDVMNALVHYSVEGIPQEPIWVNLPKGVAYDDLAFTERLQARIAGVQLDDSRAVEQLPEYSIEDVDWQVTSYYRGGEYLGEDIGRFGGLGV